MRSIDNLDSVKVFTDGFRAYYNFVRPHMGLDGRTPAEMAGLDLELGKNKWLGLIQKGIEHQKTNGAH